MNRQHQRSLSSANIDNKAFREAISKMRNDVLESKAETQRVRDQLNCLIMLVKRAWTGDETAAVHVSNIVGAPPPVFTMKSEADDKDDGKTKNAAVHRWAMLSIGLLNRHYKQLEEDGLALAKVRLQLRQEYLDQQLQCHRDLLAKERRTLIRKTRISSAPPRATATPVSGRFYREDLLRGATEKVIHSGTLVEFLYPGTKIDRQQKAVKQNRQTTRRYSQPGLYDTKGVVEKPKRPVSAIRQKMTDSQRARPKSAVTMVTLKGDRPLKNETTRPISARMTSTTFITNPPDHNSYANNAAATSTSSANNNKKPRAQSAKTYLKFNSESFAYRHRKQMASGSSGDEAQQQAWQQDDGRKGSPQDFGHVSPFQDGVSEEIHKMELMEQDFRKTTAMLQQKLGISSTGAV